jgi:hypothetical protein
MEELESKGLPVRQREEVFHLMWHGSAMLDGRRIILQFYDSSKRTKWMSEEAARLGLVAQDYDYDDLLSVSRTVHYQPSRKVHYQHL